MTSATVPASNESSLVARLSLEQKVRLLTGADGWTLYSEPAVGLRALVVSDGPAGVRGTRFDPADPSTSLPCPIALAATWDVDLVERLATALGKEARSKGIDVILGPTVNIVRTPLSGRGFECFSEDPVLSARIAVAYVRGVQSAGVGATAKHFVANDSETERHTYDARITETVLRELYLPPFEACVKEAGVLLVMAAYNSVNGATMTANAPLLIDLLKTEWKFSGVVVSDWSATHSTAPSARAGLDLVMPGPDGPWGEHLVDAVRAGEVAESAIDDKVARLLGLSRRLGAAGRAQGAAADGSLAPLVSRERELVDPALLREATARTFVLLTNRRGLLPLKAANVRTVALVGPNAVAPQTQGGGSVRVLASAQVDLARSIRAAFPQAAVTVHQGCLTGETVAAPREGSLRDPLTGRPGIRLAIQTADGEVVYDAPFPRGAVTWWDGLPPAVHAHGTTVAMHALYTPDADGPHVIGAAGAGEMRLIVDGAEVAGAKSAMPGEVVEALSRPPELRTAVDMHAGRQVEITLEYRPDQRFVIMRLGVAAASTEEDLIDDAVRAAEEADIAIVVVGSADGDESEGYDRPGLALSGRQDELVTRVVAANPHTVVVVNSGTPVLMPWADHPAAVLQAWFPGQAFGEALTDVLLGAVEPSGRLPVSIPRSETDAPVLHARPDGGGLVYGEGLLVGYRGYDRAGSEPLFAFGHGLGYTEFAYETISAGSVGAEGGVEVRVGLRNAATRAGREVVQLYLAAPDDDASRPLRTLVAFAAVDAGAGEHVEARLYVPGRAFERYEPPEGWRRHPGTYTLWVGRSSRDLRLNKSLEVP
jgi:beta-glucosidase